MLRKQQQSEVLLLAASYATLDKTFVVDWLRKDDWKKLLKSAEFMSAMLDTTTQILIARV